MRTPWPIAVTASRTSAGITSSTASASGSTKLMRGAAIARDRHAEVDEIHHDLRHGLADGVTAGRPRAAHRRPFLMMIVGQSPDSLCRPAWASIGLPFGSKVE